MNPTWTDNIPYCSKEKCTSYSTNPGSNGCILDFGSVDKGAVCRPSVRTLRQEQLTTLRALSETRRRAHDLDVDPSHS